MRSWRQGIVGVALALCAFLPAWPASGPGGQPPGRSVRMTARPDGYRIAYRWTDAKNVVRSIELEVPRRALEESEEALGFPIDDLRRYLLEAEARVRRERGLAAVDIAREAASGAPGPGAFQVSQAPAKDFEIAFRSVRPAGEAEMADLVAAFERRWQASHKEVQARLRGELKKYARAHGLRLTPDGLAVDYQRLVKASAVRLVPLADAFRRAFGPSRSELLAALHSFVLASPYRPIPPVDGGRFRSGLDVPLRVLVDDNGDCDSKSVLFAALWLNLSHSRVILIRVPEHMLAGIAVPFVRGSTLIIQSIRYALLELNCGGPARPGEISRHTATALEQGNYRYMIVS